MRGWLREAEPFYQQLKPRGSGLEDASSLFAHSFETLERDGSPPDRVYRDLSDYAGVLPWVTYDSDARWELLAADWQSLGVKPPVNRGFCARMLIQKLLDPLPANHCRIETLGQFYQLPESGPRSALTQLVTLGDLLLTVMRPLTETRGLQTWEQLTGFVEEPWFPSRLPFGKFKGRLFHDALHDVELSKWLNWLSSSSNPQSATMGAWYLHQIQVLASHGSRPEPNTSPTPIFAQQQASAAATATTQVTRYVHADLEKLRAQVEHARARLARLQATYTVDKRSVEVAQNILFRILRPYFLQRDKLNLRIHYRRRFLEVLLRAGEESAQEVARENQKSEAQKDAEYERAASAVKEQKVLTSEETEEIKRLWKKLVSLFHPDRFVSAPEKQQAYAELIREINDAREVGDVHRLREIAEDADAFMVRMGWDSGSARTVHEKEAAELKKLLGSLEGMILAALDALETISQDPAYQLYKMNEEQPGFIEKTAKEQARDVQAEIEKLEEEASLLLKQITELTGNSFEHL